MTILCATDFSPCSQAAVALATAAARRLHESVLLLHVVQPPSYGAAEVSVDAAWVVALQEAAQAALARAALEVRGAGVEVEESGPRCWSGCAS